MSIKVAITQFSMSEVYEENLAKADSLIAKATQNGAQLVLLPELFEGHYFCQVEDYEKFKLAEDASHSRTLEHFEAVAKKYHAVLPVSFFEKAGNVFFNSLGVIDADGRLLGIYRKSHIPTGECYEEKFYFAPGDTGFMYKDYPNFLKVYENSVDIYNSQMDSLDRLADEGKIFVIYPSRAPKVKHSETDKKILTDLMSMGRNDALEALPQLKTYLSK